MILNLFKDIMIVHNIHKVIHIHFIVFTLLIYTYMNVYFVSQYVHLL